MLSVVLQSCVRNRKPVPTIRHVGTAFRFSGVSIGKLMSRTCKPVRGEDRQQMIATDAYYRAAQRGFDGGYEIKDWLKAEVEVDNASYN